MHEEVSVSLATRLAERRLGLLTNQELRSWIDDERSRTADSGLDQLAAQLVGDVSNAIDAEARLLGIPPMDDLIAVRLVTLSVADKIVSGDLHPYIGARLLWTRVATEGPAAEPALRPFIGLASEWEDGSEHRSEYEALIVEEAQSARAREQKMIRDWLRGSGARPSFGNEGGRQAV